MLNKKLVLITAISILLVITLVFAFFNQNITGLISQNPDENANTSNVKIATFAICEPKDNYTYCRDKIYAACNGTPIEVIGDSFICEGKEYKVDSSNLGETYLSNFSDSRSKDFITAWAIEG